MTTVDELAEEALDTAVPDLPTVDPRVLAQELLRVKAALGVLEAREKVLRQDAVRWMHNTGATGLAGFADDDGAELGKITLSAGGWYADITDPVKLLAWVRDHHPDKIVDAVTPAFLDKLLTECKQDHHPVERGTKNPIPGICVTQGADYVTTRPNSVAKARASGAFNPDPEE